MESTSVGSATNGTTTASTTRRMEDMRPEDFFALLVAQMQTQDPMEPMSNSEIVQQISQIRDMEASTKLTQALESLISMQQSLGDQQRMGSSSALVGSYVEGTITDAEGHSGFVSGVVTGVRFAEDGAPVLQLHGGEELALGEITQVTSIEEVNRVAAKLLGKLIRGEMPSSDGTLTSVQGVVEEIKQDEMGLPILVLDDGTEMPLRYFREIVQEDTE